MNDGKGRPWSGATKRGLARRRLGAEMIGLAAEHLGHLLAWAVDGRLTAGEALGRPLYHPVLEEGPRTALRTLNARLGFDANPPARCIDCGLGG